MLGPETHSLSESLTRSNGSLTPVGGAATDPSTSAIVTREFLISLVLARRLTFE